MQKKISFVVVIAILILLYRKYFLPGPLVFGDAPYLYPERLRELLKLPHIWNTTENNLGGINMFLFIYPIMIIYGILGTFLHLSNDIILRILFYFPSVVLGFTGVYFFTKYLKFTWIISLFAGLFYLANTYYLLLVDGGQVGVVLAYGLFPLAILFLSKLTDKLSIKNFSVALVISFILTVIDFRISAISLFTAFFLNITKGRRILSLILIGVCLLGLSSYWVIPSLKLSGGTLDTSVSSLQNVSLLNSLSIFSPNWPANMFGKTITPYFYFAFVPIFIFLPLFIAKEKKIIWLTFSFLLFAFLTKGESYPGGIFYTLFVSTKIGSVFRDSTKFFTPLILIGGILIGYTAEFLQRRSKLYLGNLVICLFILLLIYQAILGQLNGVLGKNPNLADYEKVHQMIINDSTYFFRDIWFTERSPFAFNEEKKQVIDGRALADLRPFAAMNVGTGDRFNFMNNSQYLDWFNLLGVKYLIFNGNPRIGENDKQSLSAKADKSDREDWNRLMTLITDDKRLTKLNIGTNIPIYEYPNNHPNEFFVDKTFLITGGDDVYTQFLKLDKKFSVGNQGFLFVEDGKFDLASLQNVASKSLVLVFNDKTETDLKMAFLQKYFVSSRSSYKNMWALFSGADYLNYKYQLLIRGVKINDFDYGLGIAFSSKKGETISFNLNVPKDGDYILAVRKMDQNNQNMYWTFESKNLKKGTLDFTYENKVGLEIINTVALVPANEMQAAEKLSNIFLKTFYHYNLNNVIDRNKLSVILENNIWENLNDRTSTKSGWVIYTDNYSTNFIGSYPFYSMINGFYVNNNAKDFKISFKGDEYLKWGFYLSLGSFVVVIVLLVYFFSKRK